MSLLTSTVMDRVTLVDPYRNHIESLDIAGKLLEKHLQTDSSFPSFIEVTQFHTSGVATVSGHADSDYPNVPGISDVKQISTLSKLPMPPEIMEHINHIQCQCNMGLFTEISRAWLTIDSDIYVWTYEHGSDVAYFDGLGETIVTVGLVKPKPGIFNNFVRYLLILTTTVEVVVLGVTFSNTKEGPLGALEEMHLLPDPVFVVPTDGVTMTTTACTNSGRIFLGGGDGNLYEIMYQAEGGWFGKRCKKVNHSTGTFSFLIPNFVSYAFAEDDRIQQISIDNSRHILYTLSEKGKVEVFDLGESGESMSRVLSVNQNAIIQGAFQVVKTVDINVLRPIASICAVEANESPHLNFVLVTKSGVRLYYSTSSLLSVTARPYTLQLLHVRLPPGFAANSRPNRPSNVHMAVYRKGTLVMVSSPGGDKDVVWCVSNDLYPFQAFMSDMQTELILDGTSWALEEAMGQDARSSLTCLKSSPLPLVAPGPQDPCAEPQQQQQPLLTADPPLIVQQHLEPPRKYIVLTSQGVEILLKLRPVDVLKQLLVEGRGPDNPAVQRFFKELREDQACVCALILASLDSAQSSHVVEWATRAFFLYGGEPKNATENPNVGPSSPMQFSMQGTFNPPTVSTPLQSGGHQQVRNPQQFAAQSFTAGNVSAQPMGSPYAMVTPQSHTASPGMCMSFVDNTGMVNYSAKHNALYIYVGRILSPIWNLRTVHVTITENKHQFLCSNLTRDDCAWILGHLHALQAFVQKNNQFALFNTQSSGRRIPQDANETPGQSRTRFSSRDALQEEKKSFDAFKVFVSHTCEVLSLWKILCEHQFHVVADTLPKEHQNQLVAATFRNLILMGHDLCSMLVNSLLNSYLNDNASLEAISAKLREVCPHLYRTEDEACSKANEILLSTKSIQNAEEKETKLLSALQLCKKVAPHINLSLVCQWFTQAQYYEGVLEICIACAQKLDPKDMASHYYNNNEPPGDEEGYRAYVDRLDSYKEITNVLDQLHATADDFQVLKLLQLCLGSEDELLHMAIYDWMQSKDLLGDLSVVTKPSYEKYLKRKCDQDPNTNEMYDLLWKYYEKNENHAGAAKILLKLATAESSYPVSLNERIAYLARAVMCMRSDKVGCAPHLGIFLRELEDRIEVARIQKQILDAISAKPSTPRTSEAIRDLNASLLDITALYEKFAEPFGLWEMKLAIIHTSGHHDQSLIEHIWHNIIENELQNSHLRGSDDKMGLVLSKVKALGEEYSLSPRCFPVAFLVQDLELQCCRIGADNKLVFQLMLSLGVHLAKLIQIYDVLTSENDICWFKNGSEYYVFEVVASLIDDFIKNPRIAPSNERRLLATKAADLLTKCLTTLYARSNTKNLIEKLHGVQTRLNRFANEV